MGPREKPLAAGAGLDVEGWERVPGGWGYLGEVVEAALAPPARVEVLCFAEVGAFKVEALIAAGARYGWVGSWWGASSGNGLATVVAFDAWGRARIGFYAASDEEGPD